MTKYVQFADALQAVVVAVFGGVMESAPQSLEVYPFQGMVDDDDQRYLAFINPPTPAELDPVDKLKAFLAANPDVAAILS